METKEGVFIYKKILSLILIILFIFPIKVSAKGHPDFQEIILPKHSFAKLLEEYSESDLKKEYKLVKKKAFGWSIKQFNDDLKVKFVGNTIFAKANNTTQELSFLYTFEEIGRAHV